VILVPFLLVTAVFSRTAILEVQTAGREAPQDGADDLGLRVTIRAATIELSHGDRESPEIIERTDVSRALAVLAELAGRLKSRHPESQHATVLVEPQVPYELLVQVLDTLRLRETGTGEAAAREFLFPLIALGPAPASPSGAGGSR
jgi:biopolymer transport protein ExbD